MRRFPELRMKDEELRHVEGYLMFMAYRAPGLGNSQFEFNIV